MVVGSNIYEDSLAIEFILCGYQTIIRICTLYSTVGRKIPKNPFLIWVGTRYVLSFSISSPLYEY